MVIYDILLIDLSLIDSCLNDLQNFLNYCRISLGEDKIRMIYIVSEKELSTSNKMKFLIPGLRSSLTFISYEFFSDTHKFIHKFTNHSQPLIMYISGKGYTSDMPLCMGKNTFTTENLSELLAKQTNLVICITDTNHTEEYVKLNYQYDGEEFYTNNTPINENESYFFGSEQFCKDGEETRIFTASIIEQRLLTDFLKEPSLSSFMDTYDALEYFLQFHNHKPIAQINFLSL